jgi:ABC-type protease/lipase transport system fused ATPase/permease subunit
MPKAMAEFVEAYFLAAVDELPPDGHPLLREMAAAIRSGERISIAGIPRGTGHNAIIRDAVREWREAKGAADA